ncbi:MAG: hypothetical protein JNK73_11485 [Bacteroidia bacterium]|nr:hypothetical protein [Bacteroidia bacterium]
MMRFTLLLWFSIILKEIPAQTNVYFKPGNTVKYNGAFCLVIKNEKAILKNLQALAGYSECRTVKIIDFQSVNSNLDSILSALAKHLKPNKIIFENCDLSNLSQIQYKFTYLEEIFLLRNCLYDENTLYKQFMLCPVKALYIQSNQAELELDSVSYLSSLESLHFSSSKQFLNPNSTHSFQFNAHGYPRSIQVLYYGKLRNEIVAEDAKIATPQVSAFTFGRYPCIKQPLPGIDINDTIYHLDPEIENSFYYVSGSFIYIDKNAFVNANGLTHEGPVSLFYREYRNSVEIMLSGIPMINTVADEERVFKSGGMYEIWARDDNGELLKTRSDTSVKIYFALTDTSESFQFFSLNENGTWTTVDEKLNINNSGRKTLSGPKSSRAVQAYFDFIRINAVRRTDTTNYMSRFYNDEYLLTYRKDNLELSKDSTYHYIRISKKRRLKGFMKVKYLKTTKEKEIVFTLRTPKQQNTYNLPKHIRALKDRTFIYMGELDKQAFKKTLSGKFYCWDFRTEVSGDGLILDLKTENKHFFLACKEIRLKGDGTAYLVKKSNFHLHRRIQGILRREAKLFNKKDKMRNHKYNDLNAPNKKAGLSELAFAFCKKYQTTEEQKMSFEQWTIYSQQMNPFSNMYLLAESNTLGNALLKSGMGIKNIDTYIHKGQMEDIYVNYNNVNLDTLKEQYHAILFKSINTSYPFALSGTKEGELSGYYFSNHSNYFISFTGNKMMQVTKPKQLELAKSGAKIQLGFQTQYDITNKDSNAISKLILD